GRESNTSRHPDEMTTRHSLSSTRRETTRPIYTTLFRVIFLYFFSWSGQDSNTSRHPDEMTTRHSLSSTRRENSQDNQYNSLQDYLSLFLFMLGTGFKHVSSS